MRVDLCWLGGNAPPPGWKHGDIVSSAATPAAVADVMERQARGPADATVFWDSALGVPAIDVPWLQQRVGDVTHAGLLLGTAQMPTSIDFISPTWMWNCDPDPSLEATSWRLSLRACVIDHAVIRQLGSVRPQFRTLEAAALELGHRYLTRGAFVRHDPSLLTGRSGEPSVTVPLHDDILFARLCYGDFWARWALGRGLLTGEFPRGETTDALKAFSAPNPPKPTFVRDEKLAPAPAGARVTVIMPTIERYPYLRQLLPQLAAQTYPVHEIVVVDQTPTGSRDRKLVEDFPGLPIRVVYQDKPGQCTARNEALRLATGDYMLFIDDDDEVEPDLIERHLRTLHTYKVEVSCGVAEELGAGPVPEYQRFLRASDVFPTNNSMIRRRVLRDSGMFDLAYDCKMCEDGDLGVRLYLAGTLMVLDPRISVLHHRAPRGGLREHGARAITYASSRKQLTHRNLPNMSEVYLGLRYYSARQVREMLVLRTWGTLRSKAGKLHQGLKAAYGLAVLPDTLRHMRQAERGARDLLQSFPQIDPLPD